MAHDDRHELHGPRHGHARAAARHDRPRPRPHLQYRLGRASYPYAGGNVYGATKAFVRQFSLNLRADLLGTPLRVTDIEPGLCGGTEFSNIRYRGDDAKAANVYNNVQPLMPEDIADTIYWIATRPAHVNVNTIELMPIAQAPAARPSTAAEATRAGPFRAGPRCATTYYIPLRIGYESGSCLPVECAP